tara:strand:+ start:206 stop:508 length:303 start_codon:yes stop_codon:yes gene_type:complete
MDSNSDNKIAKRKADIVKSEVPHYFEIKLVNHPNCIPQMHVTREEDAIIACKRYPGSTYEKIYLPHTPDTVDVPYVAVAPDFELPAQQILPERQQEPLDL